MVDAAPQMASFPWVSPTDSQSWHESNGRERVRALGAMGGSGWMFPITLGFPRTDHVKTMEMGLDGWTGV